MFGKDEIKKACQEAIGCSTSDQIEAVVIANTGVLTRFANSTIHQNMEDYDCLAKIRIAKGKKMGSSSTNIMSSISKAVKMAEDIARNSREDQEFISLPKPGQIREVSGFSQRTADYSYQQMADDVRRVIEKAEAAGCKVAGAYSKNIIEMGCANSLGIMAYTSLTNSSIIVVAEKDGSSGYASALSSDIGKIDVEAVVGLAIEKSLRGIGAVEVPPGEYEVVLEPPAVADLLLFLGYLGFGALAYQEGRSFVSGNLGKKIVGENITIWDDAIDPVGMPVPFDFEGVPKEKVVLIENGVAKSLVYDSYTAHREGKVSTGHSLPQPNTSGPIPTNLFMKEGEHTKDELISAVKRGILITRFHYTNVIEPMRCVITGMTRDGTFLIENGKITKPIKNMRFTQSVLDALSSVSMIGSARSLSSEGLIMDFPSGYYVPCLKIDKFCFSGKTEF
ncbi:TldD/PmbA family protein [bacterium]|nr:TldD/PmbA family protein [bacterium]MBU1599895.1 TldD/PmbA family protein [bacterium]